MMSNAANPPGSSNLTADAALEDFFKTTNDNTTRIDQINRHVAQLQAISTNRIWHEMEKLNENMQAMREEIQERCGSEDPPVEGYNYEY